MDPSEVEEDDQDILLIWDLEVQAAMSASASALPKATYRTRCPLHLCWICRVRYVTAPRFPM